MQLPKNEQKSIILYYNQIKIIITLTEKIRISQLIFSYLRRKFYVHVLVIKNKLDESFFSTSGNLCNCYL